MPNYLLAVNELAHQLAQPDHLILDCSFSLAQPEQGLEDYLRGHIPGAVYAHLERDLSGGVTPTSGRHPLPELVHFSRTLATWGWQPGMNLVVYDATGGTMAAARAWWLCRYYGIDQVYLLDGGLNAWMQAGLPLETGNTHRPPASVPVRLFTDTSLLITTTEMRNIIRQPGMVLLDARAVNRYKGLEETIDTTAGHISGAISLPVTAFLQEDLRFLPAPEISRILSEILPPDINQIVYYCGSGVTSALGILAMEAVGYTGIKLYAGSFSEWIRQPWAEIASLNSHR